MVFHRGSKMHDIVPRDDLGRSNYRLAAIRPSQIDLDDSRCRRPSWPTSPSARASFWRSSTSICVARSTPLRALSRGLEALEEEVERRREISGGKRSFILVPGIDVPFHSSVLRVGVADFRHSLERVMPHDTDPELIIGRYIPNLVPRPFTLDRDFIQEIRDLVPAEPLDEILADYDTWRNENPAELCRKVVIELLAWQFASPVRWIETQDLLFIEEAAGGLGIERLRRDRREVRADRRGSGHQHAEPARIRAQHNGSAELRTRRRGVVRDRHRSRARGRGSPGC